MGDKGGKPDMDRIGLFSEMSYISSGDKYVTPGKRVFNESASKGKQMLSAGYKQKSAKQDGYFSDTFTRMMEGEAYSDPMRLRRQQKLAATKKNLSKAFMPTSGNKTMNGYGTFYGTLGGVIASFSPVAKGGPAKTAIQKNLLTNPGKKGTGYGYPNVGLNPYPPHANDDYNKANELYKKELLAHKAALKGGAFRLGMHPAYAFDMNPYRSDKPVPPLRKWAGDIVMKPIGPAFRPTNPGKLLAGMKAGTFDPYPPHSEDPYGIKFRRPGNVVNKTGHTFIPPQGPKSTVCNSIINQNVVRSINVQNFRSVTVL